MLLLEHPTPHPRPLLRPPAPRLKQNRQRQTCLNDTEKTAEVITNIVSGCQEEGRGIARLGDSLSGFSDKCQAWFTQSACLPNDILKH